VEDRETKKPFAPSAMAEVGKILKENGLFTFIMVKDLGTMVFVVPPLCITKQQLDEGLGLVEKALETADQKVK
jgi:taurine--2-oxoglutarate transaminase